MASIYRAISVTPTNKEFLNVVGEAALLLKKESKNDGKLAVVNIVTHKVMWVTTTIQGETRSEESEDKRLLTIKTENSVYTFEKIGETI